MKFRFNLEAQRIEVGSLWPPPPNYFAESNAKFELTAAHVRSGNIGAQSSWTSSIGSRVNACICMRRACNAGGWRVSSPQIGQTMTIGVKLRATRNRRGPVQLTITNSLIIVPVFDPSTPAI